MAEKVWKNCGIFFDGWNFTGDSNTLTLNHTQEVVDATPFGSSWRKRKGGLITADISVGGFWNAKGEVSTGLGGAQTVPTSGAVDAPIFSRIGGTTGSVSILPEGTNFGRRAYLTQAVAGEYNISGTIGDMLGFTLNLYSNYGKVIRGKVLREGIASTGINSNSGNTTSCNVCGQNTTTVKFYAAIHALYTTATNKDMSVCIMGSSESDFGTETTMLHWACANWDSSMGGKSKWGSTKMPSTKLRFFRLHFGSSAGTTDPKWNIVATAGIDSTAST